MGPAQPKVGDIVDSLPDQAPSSIVGREQKKEKRSKPNNSGNSSAKSSGGFHKYNTQYLLRDFFKDRDSYNFRYGLEFGLTSNLSSATDNGLLNLDEDPTVLGFDMFILNGSPLFNEMDAFFDFGKDRKINHVSDRKDTYNDFVKQFSKFFNVDDRGRPDFKTDSRFNSFKTHYLYGVQGLAKLIHHTGIGNEGGRQMTDFGKDKLTFNISEDVGLNAGYLSAIYRTLLYWKKAGRQVIPENLLRFDLVIVISEVRRFNRVSNIIAEASKDSVSAAIPVLNDNINRYVFTLHECQLDFNKYSFDDTITQGGFGAGKMGESTGISFDVFYKFVSMEMEKLNFNPDVKLDEAKYVSDIKLNPTTYQVQPDPDSDTNKQTEAGTVDKFPARTYDLRYHMNTKSNSGDPKSYEFDFPMLNAKYAKSEIDIRNKNLDTAADQSGFRKGLNSIIIDTNEGLQTRFIQARSQLISGLAASVREVTGLRNIRGAPVNVYEYSTVGQFLLGEVTDFTNLAVGTALSAGSGYLNKLSIGVENSVFDFANRGSISLQGFENTDNTIPQFSGSGEIPNVYRR